MSKRPTWISEDETLISNIMFSNYLQEAESASSTGDYDKSLPLRRTLVAVDRMLCIGLTMPGARKPLAAR